jgi:hypothetical protein
MANTERTVCVVSHAIRFIGELALADVGANDRTGRFGAHSL